MGLERQYSGSRSLAVPSECSSSISSTHMAVYNCLLTLVPVDLMPSGLLWPSKALEYTQYIDIHTEKKNNHTG